MIGSQPVAPKLGIPGAGCLTGPICSRLQSPRSSVYTSARGNRCIHFNRSVGLERCRLFAVVLLGAHRLTKLRPSPAPNHPTTSRSTLLVPGHVGQHRRAALRAMYIGAHECKAPSLSSTHQDVRRRRLTAIARIGDHKASRLSELLPQNWQPLAK